ncbi:glycoside hydrolase family 2 [Myxococcota bacterium]|nr:glycoside hydrolase family 2 [Myxococcota bacterium]
MRPKPHVLLDGAWRFHWDRHDVGLREVWFTGHEYPHSAEWPASVEAQLARLELATGPDEDVVAWYERTFSVPDAWCDDCTCEVQLVFGACGYETRVWLDGEALTTVEGERVHYGEYTSFAYELPRERLHGEHRLTVRVADSGDAELPRGKQASRVFERGGIWYQATSGAVRSAWIEPVERNRLRTRVAVVSDPSGAVELTFELHLHDAGRYALDVDVFDRASVEPIASVRVEASFEAGHPRWRVPLDLSSAARWSPSSPSLYHAVARLIGDPCCDSEIEVRFGLRWLEARGRALALNGAPTYLDGLLYQPGASSYDQIRAHLAAAKRLGCNLVRVHIAGLDPRIYDLADELGLLLWVEVPAPHRSTPKSRANHRAELERMLVHTASHPSVVFLSLYNESWGAEDLVENQETRRYIVETARAVCDGHPELLVVDDDGWHHLTVDGALVADLLTVHLYTANLADWTASLDALVAGALTEIAGRALVVDDRPATVAPAPIVVSEWGGFGFAWYGGPAEDAKRADLIRAFKRALHTRAIAGDVYTQAIDVEDEKNGILDAATGALRLPEGALGPEPEDDVAPRMEPWVTER